MLLQQCLVLVVRGLQMEERGVQLPSVMAGEEEAHLLWPSGQLISHLVVVVVDWQMLMQQQGLLVELEAQETVVQ